MAKNRSKVVQIKGLSLKVSDIIGINKRDQRIVFLNGETRQPMPFRTISGIGELHLFRPSTRELDETGESFRQYWEMMLQQFLLVLGFETERQEATGAVNFIITKTPYLAKTQRSRRPAHAARPPKPRPTLLTKLGVFAF